MSGPADAGEAPGAPPPPREPKVELLAQLLAVEAHVERLEIHERLAADRGQRLGVIMEHELAAMRAVVKTLTLLRAYEKAFVRIVVDDRRAAGRAGRSATSSPAPTTSS